MNYENIPAEIREHYGFCCWRYETRKGDRTKVPYNPLTGRRASVDRPQDFVDFETAVRYVKDYDGIGLRVSDRLLGTDLDHCLNEDGKLMPWSADILAHFGNAYVEKSPSGTGLHMLVLMPDGFIYGKETYHIKKGNLECYAENATNRFLTVTGDMFQTGDLSVSEGSVEWLLDTFMKRLQPVIPAAQAISAKSYLTDDGVIEKALNAKNSEKFQKLWNGDIADYPSQSEADLALVSILAFYCGGDREQIDRLVRRSRLVRDKWDKLHGADTYGNLTISKALSGMKEFYKPKSYAACAAEDFDPIIDRITGLKPESNERYKWTDIGAGRLFADLYKNIARYVPERGKWFVYDGKRWYPDTGQMKVMELAKQFADSMVVYCLSIQDERLRKAFLEYCTKWQNRGRRIGIIADAESVYPASMSEFDADRMLYNCQNGTIHLDRIGNDDFFTPHKASDMLTKMSGVKYDPTIYDERWERFVLEIMSGKSERTRFLRKVFGYSMIGGNPLEVLFILYGMLARNGKGTLCESLLATHGDYGCASKPEMIAMKNHVSSQGPSEDIARLDGIRFNNVSEPGKGLVLNAAQIKSMTGNDTLNARFLHENSFDFKPQFKIYINTNYLPVINDLTVFTSGRLVIIPFERHFAEDERDTSLKDRFQTPQARSTILNWMLAGYQDYLNKGLKIPDFAKAATEKYRHDSDKTRLFIEDCMEKGDDFEERTSTVYARYKSWCQDNGHYPESMKNFKLSLAPYSTVKRKRPKDGGEKTTVVTGYRLIPDAFL